MNSVSNFIQNPDASVVREEDKLSVHVDGTIDKWGATEFLNKNDFKYVKDFLNRTEKLLDISNSVRHISTICSYETVSSSDELFPSPKPKKCKDVSDEETCNSKYISHSSSEQTNDVTSPSSSSVAGSALEPIQTPKELGHEFHTHRPTYDVVQLPVYISPTKVKILADQNECDEVSKYSNTTDHHEMFSYSNEQTKKVFNSENIAKSPSSVRAATSEVVEVTNKYDDHCSPTKSNVKSKNICKPTDPTSTSNALSCVSTTAKKRFLQPQNKLNNQSKSLQNNLSKNTFNCEKKSATSTITGWNSTLLFPANNEGIEESKVEDQNNSFNNLNKEVFETSSDKSKPIFIPRLNLESFSEPNEANITKLDNSINLLSTDCQVKTDQFKPKTDSETTKYVDVNKTESTENPNFLTLKSLKKNAVRPSTAEKVQKSLLKVHSIVTRPSTADKATKPKQQKWEKSSVTLSKHGKVQLKTWSCIQRNGASVQKQNKNPLYRKSFYNSSLVQKTFPSISNSPWYNLPDEIIIHIFKFLSVHDLHNIGKVCQLFHRVANDNLLWKTVIVNDFILNDEWFDNTGKRAPKCVSLTKCNGKAVTNLGLRNFFKHCKFSLSELVIDNCTGEYMTGDAILLHASCHCRKLKSVNVAWSRTTDNGIIAICIALPTLQALNINGNSAIGDEALLILDQKHGKNLISLEMSGCFSVTSDALLSLILSTEALQKLNIGLCSKVTSECIVSMAPNLSMLTHLDLRGLKSVTNQCLHAISKHCIELKTLIISDCSSVTDVGIAEVATYRSSLIRFDISGCSQVTDEGASNFALSASMIESLDFSSTGVTYKTVTFLSNNNNGTLKTLKLSFCHNITQQCLIYLLKKAVSLKSLHIYGCKRVKLSQLMKVNNRTVIEK